MGRRLLTWISLLSLLSGCVPFSLLGTAAIEPTPAWVYADLRSIDPPDVPTATLDLIAVYLRRFRQPRQTLRLPPTFEWQIRLELRDVSPAGGADLYLALDHTLGGSRWLPGGTEADLEWDTLVKLPAHGPAQAWNAALQPLDGLPLSLQRDTLLDTVEIRLPTAALIPSRAGLRLQAITTAYASEVEADRTAPTFSEGQPPAPLQVWMAFWNTLPAYTPAQALRRWDGAHSGPYGGRHGLYNLLRTARARRIPLALLDIKALPSLAALDYAGGLPLVQRMAREGLLFLPEVQVHAAGAAGVATMGRKTALDFGLPASPAVFAPDLDSTLGPRQLAALPELAEYKLVIAASAAAVAEDPLPSLAVYAAGPQRILYLSSLMEGPQATPSGPSQEVIRLLAAAAQPGAGRQAVIALGGDLTQLGWGDPASARQSFDYLTSRPWLRFVYPGDLSTLAPSAMPAGSPPTVGTQGAAPLHIAGPGAPLRIDLAQFYASLYGPVSPATPGLAELRAAYAGQAGALRLAAAWADQPFPIQSCDQDVSEDGQAECVLASADTLAILDAASGGLVYLFVLENEKLHLLVAPSALFAVGLGDPAEWDLAAGLQADPQVIPGAFWAEPGVPGCPCQVEADGDGLLIRGAGLERRYRLLPGGGLRVDFLSNAPILWELPMAVDPWERFSPGWGKRYAGSWQGQDWVWGLDDGTRARVHSNRVLQVASFTDSQASMGVTEDPNAEYPPGHYLPFPLSLVQLLGQGEDWVEISLAHQ